MNSLKYGCEKTNLHPDLQKAWVKQNTEKEALDFQKKESSFYSIKFIFFVILSVLYMPHYTIMGLLGYDTYLLGKKNITSLLKKRYKKMLDIGSGSGSITQEFEPFVDEIHYQEPSITFQKILNKKGYKNDEENKYNYDIVTMFNVLDICENPHDMMQRALKKIRRNGIMIMSLPFPILVRSWDDRDIRKTNTLVQDQKLSFETATSLFYENFIKKWNLKVTYFTRLPYIVSLPESKKTTVYDNGLFVCKCI